MQNILQFQVYYYFKPFTMDDMTPYHQNTMDDDIIIVYIGCSWLYLYTHLVVAFAYTLKNLFLSPLRIGQVKTEQEAAHACYVTGGSGIKQKYSSWLVG